MTPKQKAEELYRTYIDYTFGDFNCKQCALIAVDEIINVARWSHYSIHDFWLEVKKEIEKL